MAASLWPAGPIPQKSAFSFSSFSKRLLEDRRSSASSGSAPAAKAGSKRSEPAFKDDAQLTMLNAWTKDLQAHLAAPASASSSSSSSVAATAHAKQKKKMAPEPLLKKKSPAAAAAAAARAAHAGRPQVTPAQKRPRPLAEVMTPPAAKRPKVTAGLGVGKTAAALAAKKSAAAVKAAQQERRKVAPANVKKEPKKEERKSAIVAAAAPTDALVKPIEEDGTSLQATATSRLLSMLKRSRHQFLSAVPLSALRATSAAGLASGKDRKEKRCRMRPLEAWRNERQCFERRAGSDTPSVSSVLLNFSPKPEGDVANVALAQHSQQLMCLQSHSSASQSNGNGGGDAVEVVGLCSDALKNSTFNLPPWRPAGPTTVPLPGSDQRGSTQSGILYVERGAVRVGWKNGREGEEVVLGAGDSALYKLSHGGRLGPLLVASTLPELPTSLLAAAETHREATKHGARIRWVIVSQMKGTKVQLPLADEA